MAFIAAKLKPKEIDLAWRRRRIACLGLFGLTAISVVRRTKETGLDIWMFAAAAVLALLVAGLTVSGQALRVARSDPARSLRYE